jgi:photosystem II stability/assembly factor-like uncharacterized protein
VRITFVWAIAAAVTFLAVRPASANGRFPASNQIIFSPTNENIIVGRATWAVLPSTDNGKTWGYLCEDTLALPGAASFEDPEIGLTANNAIIAGLSVPTPGLDVSNDLGCNWNCIGGPLANQQIADVVVRPDLPHQVLAVTGTSNTIADGATASQVYQSTDDGATWTALGSPLDPTVTVATIDVVNGDPNRIYVSGTRAYNTARTASLFVSMDAGTTWVEHQVTQFNPPIPCVDGAGTQCPSEDSLFIAAVDPTDPDRVYLRSNGLAGTGTPGNSRLYVTTDGGQTFQVAKSFTLPTQQSSDFIVIGEMLGFALTPDGSTVYIGTIETGLWKASKTDLAFTQVNPKIQVQCLAARQTSAGAELWACSPEISGFVIGKSTNGGVSFTAMMPRVTSTNGLIACSPNGSTSSACFATGNASICSCSSYQQFCEVEVNSACLGCGQPGAAPPAPDGGVDDGGSGGGGVSVSKPPVAASSSCGCSVVGRGGATGLFAGCAILVIALRRRRTR